MGDAEEVAAWLETSGFPLEYAVSRVLTAAGLKVDTHRFYQPRSGDAPREVDIVARTDRRGLGVTVRAVLECKVAPTPWVVLTRSDPVTESEVMSWSISTTVAREIAQYAVDAAIHWNRPSPAWFGRTPSPHGAVVVGLPRRKGQLTDREGPHDALRQVVDASQGILGEALPSSIDSEMGTIQREQPALVWPIVVIRGSLFQVIEDEAAGAVAAAVPWQRIIWGGATAKPIVVDLVSESHLPEYAPILRDGLFYAENNLEGRYNPETGQWSRGS